MAHKIRYAYFFDFHTSPVLRKIGDHFDAEKLAKRLASCGVDFLTFPARCNMGMAYYDTKIGIRHYGLEFDLFGTLVEACQKYHIAVNAYFNGGISQEETRLHPNWQCRPMTPPRHCDITPYTRTTCGNSPYHDHLIAMMCEVAERYPVCGFFVDCMGLQNCLCEYCLERMKQAGVNAADPVENNTFTRKSVLRFAEDISRAVRAINPDYLLYFNSIGYEEQRAYSSYLDFECIPSKSDCDYEYLPLASRYMRTLDYPQRVNMTGRFHLWGDFGGLRTETSIRQELLTGLANGMRPNIGDHLLPHGDLCEGAMQQTERIYHALHSIDEYCDDAVSLADIALCYPKKHSQILFDKEVRGAARMLSELHCQFDVVSAFADWKRYALLVLPDSVILDDASGEKMQDYLAHGGKIIASGESGLNKKRQFLPEWGINYAGECPFSPAYFKGKLMAESLYSDGILLKGKNGTESLYPLIAPAVNREWDGLYSQYYNPPETETQWPLMVVSPNIIQFSHKIFSGYKLYGAIPLRNLLAESLEKLLPEPLFQSGDLPKFARATMTRQPSGRIMIHLLAHIPERRAIQCEIIEEDLLVPACTISVKTAYNHVRFAQTGARLASSRKGNRLEIQVPSFRGYALLILDP